ncbi:MAG: SDR family NAD(P)-dependent oxidoreductase [Pseudomonadales bacterium]
MKFDNQVVLVTGGNRGLGKAFSNYLAQYGATVIVHSSGRDDSGERMVFDLRNKGLHATHLAMELGDGGALISAAKELHSRIDAMVHNAGFVRDRTIAKMSDEDWTAVQHIHLGVAFQLARAAWSDFKEASYGRLVFISSASGLYGNYGQANYGAAKLGMVGLCKTLAVEGAKYNIGVNCVAPIGATEMNSAYLSDEMIAKFRPELVAPLVAYLCHPACSDSGGFFEAGGGTFKRVRWERSQGLKLDLDTANISMDDIAAGWSSINEFNESEHPATMDEASQGL